jgi:proteasome accessory factor A
METCVKVLGSDFELANAVEGGGLFVANVYDAARRLLAEVPGYPRTTYWGGSSIEWGRRFLAGNGGSAYIDSDHLEINLPEHTPAADHAAHVWAGLRIAQRARAAANEKRPDARILVHANVSDGQRSWGHHLNVMVRRALWDDLFTRKPYLAGFLATHLATAILYTGQGQVGAGNGRAECDYQLAQRPDFFAELMGTQTTYRRPLLNARDEAHAGGGLARMHLIYFDMALMPVANYLKAGTTQLVLALAEAGWADPALQLDDPLEAGWDVSRDLTLRQPLALAGRGRRASAVEVQRRLADLAGEFVASGEADACVPGAADVVACWQETLDWLARRELGALARRCDWALKYLLLDRQRGRRGLSWDSAEIKCLDLRYANLDPVEGLFIQLAAGGRVEGMPSEEAITRFVEEPPEDTRAYLRAHALRRFGDDVADMDWDRIRFRSGSDRYWSPGAWMGLPDPTAWGKEQADAVLAGCATTQDLVDAIGGLPERPKTYGDSWNREPWAPATESYSYPRYYGQ